MNRPEALPNGVAAAAVLASGIGCLALGALTTLAEALPGLSQALNFYNPVGPLSGKTTVAVLSWLMAWAVLHIAWKNRNIDFGKITAATLLLIALGFLGTFPLFFGLFGH